MYPPVFGHAVVIPLPLHYRVFFGNILDKIIMSLQSDNLMTSELQFGFEEHASTIMCSTLLVENVE